MQDILNSRILRTVALLCCGVAVYQVVVLLSQLVVITIIL